MNPLRTKNETEKNIIKENWGSLSWLANSVLTNSEITAGHVIIKAGKANPRHCHDTCEEILCLLRGKLTHSFGDKSIEITAGDTLVVPPGIMHNGINTGDEDADMIVIYSTGQRDFREEK
ncbi:cupin domain-containing protein [bacterium]|nr:cupin domain-containing protein [bacterium]